MKVLTYIVLTLLLASLVAQAAPIQFPPNPAEGQTFSSEFANYQFLNGRWISRGVVDIITPVNVVAPVDTIDAETEGDIINIAEPEEPEVLIREIWLPGANSNWQKMIFNIPEITETALRIRAPLVDNPDVAASVRLRIKNPNGTPIGWNTDTPPIGGFIPAIPNDADSSWLLWTEAGDDHWRVRRLE